MQFRSPAAIAIGLLCAFGTAWTLFWDVRSIADINVDHVTTALVLIITVAAGHFVWPAVCKGQVLPALGFTILLGAGTFICVAGSAGRGDEVIKSRAAEANKTNEARHDLKGELDKARAKRDELAEKFAKECASGKGPKCEGIKSAIEYADSHIRILQVRYDDMKPEQIANAKLKKAAEFIVFFTGADRARTEQGLELLWPFAMALLGELGTIVFLSYGLAREEKTRQVRRISPSEAFVTIGDIAKELGMEPRVARAVLRERKIDKPPQGWAWPAPEAVAIKQLIAKRDLVVVPLPRMGSHRV